MAVLQYDGGVDNQLSTNVKSSNYANLMIARPNANLCQLPAVISNLMSLLNNHLNVLICLQQESVV